MIVFACALYQHATYIARVAAIQKVKTNVTPRAKVAIRSTKPIIRALVCCFVND